MKLSANITVASIPGFIFWLGFILIPAVVLGLYDASTNDVGRLHACFIGGFMVGFADLLWGARNAQESDAQRAIGMGFCISFLIALVVGLFAQVNGVLNALGRLGSAILLLFTQAFGYFQFVRPGVKMVRA